MRLSNVIFCLATAVVVTAQTNREERAVCLKGPYSYSYTYKEAPTAAPTTETGSPTSL